MSYQAAIISASNDGARCLVSGDYSRATQYLMEAFKKLTSSNGRYHKPNAKEDQAISRRRKTAALGQLNVRCATGSIHPTGGCGGVIIDDWMNTVSTTEGEVDDGQYLYSSPIFIPLGDFPGKINDKNIDKVLLSVIVSFNFGLAILELSRTGKSSRSGHGKEEDSATVGSESWRRFFFFQSLKLFQHSFRMQRSLRKKSVQSPLFFLAAVNNMGVLYSRLGKISQANKCFQQMLSLLMYMNHGRNNTGGEATRGSGGVTANNFNAFLNNIPPRIISSTTCVMKNDDFAGGDLVALAA